MVSEYFIFFIIVCEVSFKNLHELNFFNQNLDRSIDEMSELKSTAIFVSNFNEVETLKAYRHYAWKNFGKSTNQLNFYKFFVELSNQYGLANLNELIDDFYYLEDKYSDLKKHIDVMPMYQSIRDQLEHPKQQLEGSKSLRNIFHAALLGKTKLFTVFTTALQRDTVKIGIDLANFC